jgi:hypothetical protein
VDPPILPSRFAAFDFVAIRWRKYPGRCCRRKPAPSNSKHWVASQGLEIVHIPKSRSRDLGCAARLTADTVPSEWQLTSALCRVHS